MGKDDLRGNGIMDKHDKEEILEHIMVEYGNDLLRLAYSYVKNKAVAEDMAQDVFIKCYTNLHRFRGKSSLKTWLFQITANRCKDYLRSWNHKYTKASDRVSTWTKGKEGSPEDALIEKHEYRELSNHVLSLPVKYREVIYLFYFEELPVKKISELLNLNENTVKSRMSRARRLLEQKYAEGGNDNG